MKRIAVILFIVGLLFEFAAFFGDQAANIPFVMNLVAPKYAQAQLAIRTLDANKKTLESTDTGFAVISELFMAKLREQNDPKEVAQISIQKFSRGNAKLGFSPNRAREVIPITVTLSNGQELEWNLASLTTRVAELQNRNLFGYTLIVFLTGVVIQCIGFIVDKRPKTIEEL